MRPGVQSPYYTSRSSPKPLLLIGLNIHRLVTDDAAELLRQIDAALPAFARPVGVIKNKDGTKHFQKMFFDSRL